MAIIVKRNQAILSASANAHAVWFDFMQDLIANGWRVLGSGDGVTFENDGQKVLGAAFGRIVTPGPGSLLDGETFTLDDGTTSVVFEFDTVPDGVGGGNVVVDISAAVDEFDVRDAIVTAINGSALAITAGPGFRAAPGGAGGDPANTAAVVLANDATGAGGNTSSSETVANGDFSVSDMTGGGVAAGGIGGAYHLFTSAVVPIDQSSPWTAGQWGNINPFPTTLGGSWIRIASPAGAFGYTELLFQVRFAVNPGVDEHMIVNMCRGSQRFNVAGSEWQRPGVNTGIALAFGRTSPIDNPEEGGFGVPAFAAGGDGHAHWIVGDETVDYDFFFWTHRDGIGFNGEVFADFGRLRVVGGPTRSDLSEDPDPYVWITAFESGTGNTNHNFNNGEHFFSDTGGPFGQERLEDRVGTGQLVTTVMSLGLDDPGVPASIQGHYGGHLAIPGVVGFSPTFYDQMGGSPGLDRTLVDTSIKVGRATDDPEVTREFYKGTIKNDLIGLTTRRSDFPVVERGVDVSDPFRVSWGRFHILWDAEERVEGF